MAFGSTRFRRRAVIGAAILLAAGQLRLARASGAQGLEAAVPEMSGGGAMAGGVYFPPGSSLPLARSPEALSPLPAPPLVSPTFTGFGFDDDAIENGGVYFVPPDPIGAAGTDRLGAVVNSMIEARTKTGTLLWRDSLADLFTSLAPAGTPFDPKVVYDQYAGRFLVVALELVQPGAANPSPANVSRALVAVSKTATPATATAADWYYAAIDTKISIGGTEYWADYPGFELDEEAVYLTANLFAFAPISAYGGVRLWIVDKGVVGGFYAGGASVTVHDPYAGGGISLTSMPCQVYGAGGVGPGIGTFLVGYDGLTDGTNEYIEVVRIDDPLGAVAFSPEYVNVGDMDAGASWPEAPQLGTATQIDAGDRRALDCVWRANRIWLTTTVNPSAGADAGQATAHWIRLDTSAVPAPITLSDQGDIGGEDIAPGTYTFFPSLAVNTAGDALFGFAAAASTIYAGAYVALRQAGDPAGTVQASQTVKAGIDYYVRTFGAGNRWGDYSGMSLDPTSDYVFWVFNEYADTRGTTFSGEDGRWRTVWGKVSFTPPPSTTSTTTSSTTSTTNTTLPSNGITGLKLILVDNYSLASKAKVVFVSRDTTPGAIHKPSAFTPLSGTVEIIDMFDPSNVGVYDLAPANWIVNNSNVAKYVFKTAGAGTDGARVVVVKPNLLLKVVGKNLGDGDAATGSQGPSDLELPDLIAVRVRVTMVDTANNLTDIMCSDFLIDSLGSIAGGTGWKFTSRTSTAPASCF